VAASLLEMSNDNAANKAAHVREFFCSSFFFSLISLKSMLAEPKFKIILLFIFFIVVLLFFVDLYLFWIFFIGLYLFNYYIKYGINFFYCCFFIIFLICFFFQFYHLKFYFIYFFIKF